MAHSPAYDELGRLALRTVQGAGAKTFQYDDIGRLTTHTSDFGSFALSCLGQTEQITSRQLASSTLETATYNNLNQLTHLPAQTLTYDAVGNLTSHGQRSYTWDAENRLVGIAYPAQPGKQTRLHLRRARPAHDDRQHAGRRRQYGHDVVPVVRRRAVPGAQCRQFTATIIL
jgi:YD repeat-containing protein